MKDSLLQIINHYGINNQLRKFNEECFELKEAIINYEKSEEESCRSSVSVQRLAKEREHIKEEIADVCVMLEQFIEYYNIDRNDVEKIMIEKIHRQLKRIESENDEILDEEEFEDIDLINLTYQDNHNQIEINEYLRTMLNQLIRNQKKIIERLNKV